MFFIFIYKNGMIWWVNARWFCVNLLLLALRTVLQSSCDYLQVWLR